MSEPYDGQRRERPAVALSEALDAFLGRSGLLKKSRDFLVAMVWADVVGEWYAGHTQVVRCDQGVITIACDSAPLAQQLKLDAPEVTARLNRRLGGEFVKELRPSSGGLKRSRILGEDTSALDAEEAREIADWPLTPQDERNIMELAASVDDEDLRVRYEHVLRRAWKLRAWQTAKGWHPCATCEGPVPPNQTTCEVCAAVARQNTTPG